MRVCEGEVTFLLIPYYWYKTDKVCTQQGVHKIGVLTKS